MEKMTPLVTIIVLCYRNFRYVYQTLDSVFSQDYPNIELIVSDDGSVNFPEDEIRTYITRHAGKNIASWRINHNAQNVGTVKHLNIAVKLAQGDFFMSVSADDMIDHASVVSTYVRELSARPDADILMAQTAMYDERMKKIQYYFVQPHIRDILLHHQDGNALFNELVQHPYLPSVSTFFRHAFFEKYGYFDESYDLVEDWSLHLKIARNRVPIVYIDFVSIRHRSGGISHGNTAGTSSSYWRFIKDLQLTYDREIKPYFHLIEPEIRDRVKFLHRMDIAWNDWHSTYKHQRMAGIFKYLKKHWVAEMINRTPEVYHYFKGKQWHLIIAGLLLGCFSNLLSAAFGISCNLLFGRSEAFFICLTILSTLSALLVYAGVIFLVLYGILAFYSTITDGYQIYF